MGARRAADVQGVQFSPTATSTGPPVASCPRFIGRIKATAAAVGFDQVGLLFGQER